MLSEGVGCGGYVYILSTEHKRTFTFRRPTCTHMYVYSPDTYKHFICLLPCFSDFYIMF